MKTIVVLGAGLVGKEVARDLAKEFAVTAVDRSAEALAAAFDGSAIATIQADCSDSATIKELVSPFDLVVGALPGFLGKMALQAVIEAGKDIVDIAFFPEDPFDLDDLARRQGVTAIVDFGVAPGMSNVFMGYHNRRLHQVERFECLVGGLPRVREFPFEYKAVFSPLDVIEEYTRPARYIEYGREIIRPALSDPELINFPGVGTLESFNTDGLRSLAVTMKAPFMKEKTLRYPGHIRLMQALRDSGFFDKTPIEIRGVHVSPLEMTAKILFPQWKLHPGEEDFTVMRVTIQGINQNGRRETIVYHLLDRFDKVTTVTSMARTTGYACTAAARLVATGGFARPGICPPEYVGEDESAFAFVMRHQKDRGIHYDCRVTEE